MSEHENNSTAKRKYKESRDRPVIMRDLIQNKYYEIVNNKPITDVSYEKDKGSRDEVLQGIAFRTKGLKKRSDFIVTDKGDIKSLTKHTQGKIRSNLDPVNLQRKNKKFEFYYKHHLVFECTLEKRTCSKEGCNKETDYPIEYCASHLKPEMSLTVKPTTLKRHVDGGVQKISGHGLFAWSQDVVYNDRRENKIIFRDNDLICFYYGKKLTEEEVVKHNDEENNPHAQLPYSLSQRSKQDIVDASCIRGIGSFANHKCQSKANAKIGLRKHPVTQNMMSCLVAQKIIRNGDEIFVNYGYDPSERFQDYQYKTTNVNYNESI
jgi:hypothetical protein